MACSEVGSGILQKMWKRPVWEGVWPCLDPWDSVRLRTTSTHWNVPGKYGPHGEPCFFLIKKEQVVASDEVLPNPFVSAETVKACALVGLHLLAAEGEGGSSGGQACPVGPEWISSCSASETPFGCDVFEHNNECRAIEVIGQDWSSEVVALFLEDWELRRVALSCHMTMDVLCQDMRDACWDSSDSLGEGCGERKYRKKECK